MRKINFGGINYFMYFLISFFVACFFYFMVFRKKLVFLEGLTDMAAEDKPIPRLYININKNTDPEAVAAEAKKIIAELEKRQERIAKTKNDPRKERIKKKIDALRDVNTKAEAVLKEATYYNNQINSSSYNGTRRPDKYSKDKIDNMIASVKAAINVAYLPPISPTPTTRAPTPTTSAPTPTTRAPTPTTSSTVSYDIYNNAGFAQSP